MKQPLMLQSDCVECPYYDGFGQCIQYGNITEEIVLKCDLTRNKVMKANAPEKLYYAPYDDISKDYPITDNDIEYTRTDAFIAKVINFLNYKLDDIVAIRLPGTIIPHHVVKRELIEDLKKYMEE